ncbi:histone-like nucleoid-structuring protein Lsr2 [Streptomyces sp. NPDC001089]
MAQRVIISLVDDIDGTTATETVKWSLDGVDYEIDLSGPNADTLRARLKNFKQHSRVVSKRSKRPARPMTEPAGDGATLSRHQSGTDPAAARAWAIEHGLIASGQRGRLGTKYKDAYRAYQRGDTGPLNDLKTALAALDAPEDATTPGALRPDTDPALKAANTAEKRAQENEAKAREFYLDLMKAGRLSPRALKSGYWERRTAGGLERTDKVEKMSLVERMEILTPRNHELLAKLAGITAPDGPGRISHLKSSVDRLENLEVVVQDNSSPYGWVITDFGRHAHEMYSGRE